ncbi:hypothetical protein THOM_0734 [Trachipleistophora hominis]|uniref:Uncharacterized protein n=1 Tax=Trachipleistophora hominis TaxID=72359 RepID=L7JXY4_TRAHO|nr:hypothetical protein THOM_0734 [Trachipleistophora hominis]
MFLFVRGIFHSLVSLVTNRNESSLPSSDFVMVDMPNNLPADQSYSGYFGADSESMDIPNEFDVECEAQVDNYATAHTSVESINDSQPTSNHTQPEQVETMKQQASESLHTTDNVLKDCYDSYPSGYTDSQPRSLIDEPEHDSGPRALTLEGHEWLLLDDSKQKCKQEYQNTEPTNLNVNELCKTKFHTWPYFKDNSVFNIQTVCQLDNCYFQNSAKNSLFFFMTIPRLKLLLEQPCFMTMSKANQILEWIWSNGAARMNWTGSFFEVFDQVYEDAYKQRSVNATVFMVRKLLALLRNDMLDSFANPVYYVFLNQTCLMRLDATKRTDYSAECSGDWRIEIEVQPKESTLMKSLIAMGVIDPFSVDYTDVCQRGHISKCDVNGNSQICFLQSPILFITLDHTMNSIHQDTDEENNRLPSRFEVDKELDFCTFSYKLRSFIHLTDAQPGFSSVYFVDDAGDWWCTMNGNVTTVLDINKILSDGLKIQILCYERQDK